MQFTLIFTSIISLASAAAIEKRAGVCGGITSPVCCELSVLGVANLNCQNPGPVTTTEEFKAACAAEGLAASCCTLSLGGDSLVCAPA